MTDPSKTNKELIEENSILRQRIRELEQSESEWKKEKEELIKSEACFRSYFDLPLYGIAITSPEKGWVQVNDRICSILGYSRDEIVRMTWPEITHPDDLAADLKQFSRVLSGQSDQYNMDKRFIRKDGKVVWTHLSVGCVRKPDGSIDHTIAMIEDITNVKLAEEALKESEERYRSLFENSIDAVLLTAPDGRIMAANPEARRIFGHTEVEICRIGRAGLMDLTDPRLESALEERVRTGQFRGELTFVRKEGTSFPGEISSVIFRDRDGNSKTSMIIRDITDRKQAEIALRESEEDFRSLFQNAPIGIFHSVPEGRYLRVNPALSRIMGYASPEEMISSITDISTQIYVDSKKRSDIIATTIENADWVYAENLYRRKDGTIITANLAVRKHLNSDGTMAYLEGFVEDITERKRVEDALRRAEERYRTLFARAGDGIFIMSGNGKLVEVNQSFARMHGYSMDEMLQMNLKDLDTPETFQLAPERMRRIMHGEMLTFEVEHYHKDGHVFPLEVSASLISSEGESYVQCFHRDISERKKDEQEKAILAEIGQVISSTLEIEEVFKLMAVEIRKLIPYDSLIVNMRDTQKETLVVAYVYGLDIPGRRVGDSFPVRGTMSEEVIRTKRGVILQSENTEDLVGKFPSLIVPVRAGMRSLMSVPLIFRDEVIGNLIMRSNKPDTYNEENVRLAEKIGIQIAGAIANAQLFKDLSKTEKTMRESEERFRALVEQAAVGVAEIDMTTGRFFTVNHRLCEMVGMTERELLATTFQAITHPDDLYLHEDKTALLLAGKIGHYYLEKRYVRKDGAIIWVNITVSPLWKPGENPGHNMIVVEDITERKLAEDALRDSEERHRMIIETLSDAVLLRSKEIVIYANPAAFKLFRANQPGDLIGKRYLDLVHPDDRAISAERVKKNIDENRIASPREHRIIDMDGQVVHVESTGVPFNYRGETQVFGVFRDITERKLVEYENRTLTERLQRSEKMEALGQLAGGVAHDLNNVLGILSGYSELLLEEIPEGHRSRGHVEKILQSTEKGAAIIQDLLTLARRGVMVSDVINLNSVVSGFLKTPVFEKMKDYHPRVTFRTECDKNLLNIKGSPIHLEKTVMNLVVNAAESISGKGEVTIRTESRYLDKPVKGYDELKEGDYAVLTVSDTGAGIPAENIKKIFEPFFTKKTMGRSGTGLGLAIVWGTVKDHNGYLDVQTEVGQGTVFTLFFPATREGLIALQQKVQIEQYMGNGESVLVVDDIAEQRDVASILLTRLGYEVHVVSSGEAAVEYLKGNKADILVLDMIMLPGIDGLETYQRVLKISPKQKAILVSGFSETERVKEAQRLGAGAYVKKPYLMEKIGVAVKKELDRK